MSSFRWKNSTLETGAKLEAFWRQHLNSSARRVLYVLARGFDPRMCLGIEMLKGLAGKNVSISIALIEFSEGASSPSRAYSTQVDENMKRLISVVGDIPTNGRYSLQMRAEDGRRIASPNALRLFGDFSQLNGYDDIILDVSAAPRGVYLPLAAKILHWVDTQNAKGAKKKNFHVIVAEDSELDAKIQDEGVEERADYISPFKGAMDREATASQPRVWIPILGEHQAIQLERIHDLVKPDEICAVLPSPARNPRRADNIVSGYHGLLFDNWRLEPRSFIYGSEHNPYEVYRQIARTICGYRESFEPLGGAKFVVSALSSKLLSLSSLLVAYDFKRCSTEIGIAHVDCHGYSMDLFHAGHSVLSGLWLAGEWELDCQRLVT